MNEIERKQLQGLGGWLMLFQIYIIYEAINYGMALIILPLLIAFYNRPGIMYVFNPFLNDFLPYFIVITAISFALLVVCTVLFYKRKRAFRTFFVIESAVMIASMILFYIENMDSMIYFVEGDSLVLMIAMHFIFTASMHVAIIPNIAFIIALYKSQRVKNTFS